MAKTAPTGNGHESTRPGFFSAFQGGERRDWQTIIATTVLALFVVFALLPYAAGRVSETRSWVAEADARLLSIEVVSASSLSEHKKAAKTFTWAAESRILKMKITGTDVKLASRVVLSPGTELLMDSPRANTMANGKEFCVAVINNGHTAHWNETGLVASCN